MQNLACTNADAYGTYFGFTCSGPSTCRVTDRPPLTLALLREKSGQEEWSLPTVLLVGRAVFP